ncbi:MAG TPA: hypothetical protein VI168_18750 [Croceibacterium sp.]
MASVAFKVIGAIGLASYAIAFLCAKRRHIAYHRFRLVAVPASGLPAMPRGYTWRKLGRAELARHEIDAGPRVQAERFAAGLECLAVFSSSGELVGVSWIGSGSHEDPLFGIRYELPPLTAWDTGLWVPEDKRMTRAFAALWAAIGEWLRHEGLAWTMSSIADYNVASITAHRRLGARELRSVTVIRVGKLQISLGARPSLRWRGEANAPIVRLPVPITN